MRQNGSKLITPEVHRLYVGRNWLETKPVKEPLKMDLVVLGRFNSSS